ncbi:CMP/dCMP deaminase zinc-binding protein [Turneriella parva DSM 21527]|uniref:CMP/dCMP deaminase zinc-binding protein n=2 Tax=Turneriella TaxID=338321 RepID=I4B4M7_TURPD|nr:CMP/dCMP deaminase zinc-binding protein [Turneriella parva DSM 21527]
MTIAFAEAQEAFSRGEYPVGAVLLRDGEIIAKAGNRCVADVDPTAHAEVLVIREGYKKLRSVSDCTLYTTLFPCPMCEKTIVEVGIRRVVYGATSFRWIREHKYVHLVPEVEGPVMQTECRDLFERRLRENGRKDILDFERQARQ